MQKFLLRRLELSDMDCAAIVHRAAFDDRLPRWLDCILQLKISGFTGSVFLTPARCGERSRMMNWWVLSLSAMAGSTSFISCQRRKEKALEPPCFRLQSQKLSNYLFGLFNVMTRHDASMKSMDLSQSKKLTGRTMKSANQMSSIRCTLHRDNSNVLAGKTGRDRTTTQNGRDECHMGLA